MGGVNWEDLAKDNVTAILKVYTVAKPIVPPTPVVPSKPVITGNKDVVMLYSAGTAYKVRVTIDGRAVVGEYVPSNSTVSPKRLKPTAKVMQLIKYLLLNQNQVNTQSLQHIKM